MGKNYMDVLIVDDQPGVRLLLFETLVDEGYNVKMVGSGAEAMKFLSGSQPSLVLLDMKMPIMTGLETLQEIRKHYGNLPVVMMTAYGDIDIINQTKALGVKHFLNKPFDLDDVRALVKALLSESRQLNALQVDIS